MKRLRFKLPDSIIPRDYQESFPNLAHNLISSDPDTWHLFSAPTGTGKSIAELLALATIQDSILITPRIEIIAGMMEKLGHYVYDLSDDALTTLSWQYNITTPIRLRSMLSKGLLSFMPSCLLIDECHHDYANTYQDITMYLNGCPKVGLTASPYRGTPKQTQAFRSQWGNKIHSLIDLPTAINKGYCTLPTPTIWPLLDDDTIDVVNGEFKLNTPNATFTLQKSLEDVAKRVKPFFCSKTKLYDKPTMFSLSNTLAVKHLSLILSKAGLPHVCVTAETSRSDRNKAFQQVINSTHLLLQINVVSEGVDLPIARLIDLSPTMSPVKWVQQLGRIMRPNLEPEYICCCRNLERHCYLMEGLFPNSTVKDAQNAFSTDEIPLPTKRGGIRVVGLEGLGKFAVTPIHLMDGTVGFLYNLVHTSGYQRTEYIAFIHPNFPEPARGMKINREVNGEMKWGRWQLVESLPDLKGCISAKTYELSEKQLIKWNQNAHHVGLNPHKLVTVKEFQILPFLLDTGLKFRT